tara:strand:+ start:906 stop:1541 length:636 start_codon:yes stop_codon:yes gene_type:complete
MKHQLYITCLFISFLLVTSVAHSTGTTKYQHKLLLEEHPDYLTYETPEKGEMNAKILLEDKIMIVELFTPVYNIHGVETAPNLRSEEENLLVANARQKFLNSPQQYFTFSPSKACTMQSLGYRLEQVEAGAKQAQPQNKKWHHYNVRAELIFTCSKALPESMSMTIFKAFPNLKEIHTQFIAYHSDLRRTVLTPEKPTIQFTRSSGTNIKK